MHLIKEIYETVVSIIITSDIMRPFDVPLKPDIALRGSKSYTYAVSDTYTDEIIASLNSNPKIKFGAEYDLHTHTHK